MICLCSIKKYCSEDITEIENYEKAVTSQEIYECHHRLETHNSDGEKRLTDITVNELKALDMYYNRPANELIFLEHHEHRKLHLTGTKRACGNKNMLGKHFTEESKKKMSNSCKTKIPVICTTTNEIFDSIKAASISLRVARDSIKNVLEGRQIFTKGLHFEYI